MLFVIGGIEKVILESFLDRRKFLSLQNKRHMRQKGSKSLGYRGEVRIKFLSSVGSIEICLIIISQSILNTFRLLMLPPTNDLNVFHIILTLFLLLIQNSRCKIGVLRSLSSSRLCRFLAVTVKVGN